MIFLPGAVLTTVDNSASLLLVAVPPNAVQRISRGTLRLEQIVQIK
jgi:hypothetical protein